MLLVVLTWTKQSQISASIYIYIYIIVRPHSGNVKRVGGRSSISPASFSLKSAATTNTSHRKFLPRFLYFQKMALGGTAPPRGSAAATANMRRRRTTSGGASGGAAGNMLQFYTDDAPGLKISPNVVLVMSIGFIAFVAVLHVMGKLYFVRREA
ncbi:hypothetical protein ACSQ67_026199 [Phaseolus vulgaris]